MGSVCEPFKDDLRAVTRVLLYPPLSNASRTFVHSHRDIHPSALRNRDSITVGEDELTAACSMYVEMYIVYVLVYLQMPSLLTLLPARSL
jgi:hypothetical protein